ncbi:Protein fantom [Gaertneriomyces sp. JEL0708]|nr:Protein fantom [Gaertneriomyces sp. JEL0708]
MASQRAGLITAGLVPRADALGSPDDEDLYTLRNENLILKKKVNDQDEKAKQLMTKVQKLSDDLRKLKDVGTPQQTERRPRAAGAGASHRDLLEMNSLVDDLRERLRGATKENSQLRSKVNFFKSLHQAEARHTGRYDHIPARIDSGRPRKLYPATAPKRSCPSGTVRKQSTPIATDRSEEIEKLEQLVAMLREKLASMDTALAEAQHRNTRLAELQASQEQQSDLDKLSLQREQADLLKEQKSLQTKCRALEEQLAALSDTHKEAVAEVEVLGEDLKEERAKRSDLEAHLRDYESWKDREKQLNIIIEDLQAEKRILEEEQLKILQSRSSSVLDNENESERQRLEDRIQELEQQLATAHKEKEDSNASLQLLKSQLSQSDTEKQKALTDQLDAQHELRTLKERLAQVMPNGDLDLASIAEALTLLRLKNERGLSLETLLETDRSAGDRRAFQELRMQYAQCVEDMEKTRKLLVMQEHINKDYKQEVEHLNKKLEAVKNEYELRLEEDSRLLDLRGNKIAQLEAQLKHLAYGTSQDSKPTAIPDEDVENIELEKGQNLVTVHVGAGLLNDEGVALVRRLTSETRDAENIMTFVYYDFLDFETQITPLGMGLRPQYNVTSRFKVFVDDFFLMYLQSQPVALHLCVSDGLSVVEVGLCTIIFKDLTDPHRTDRLQYYGDLISIEGNNIIGKLNYSLRTRLPMAQTIRAFKERTVALNLLNVGDKVGSRNMNELIISINKCTGLIPPLGKTPKVYLSFQPPGHDSIITDTVSGTVEPELNYRQCFLTPMSLELDRALRTGTLDVLVLDDNDGLENYVYGIAKVPMLNLALNEVVEGFFSVKDANGRECGRISLTLSWGKAYQPLNVSRDGSLVTAAPARHEASSKNVKLQPSPAAQVNAVQASAKAVTDEAHLSAKPGSVAVVLLPTADKESSHLPHEMKPRKSSADPNVPADEHTPSIDRAGDVDQLREDAAASAKPPDAERYSSQGADESTNSQTDDLSERSFGVTRPEAEDESSLVLDLASSALPETEGDMSDVASSVAQDEVVHSTKRLSEAVHKETMNSDSEGIIITMFDLKMDTTVIDVDELIQAGRKVFVGFDFLDYPQEELETDPQEIEDSGEVELQFSKFFPMSESVNARGRFSLQRRLKSPDEREALIEFCIIAEGLEEPAELAVGNVNLKELLSLPDDKDNETFAIPLVERTSHSNIGVLTIEIAGASFLKTIL